MRLLLDEHHNYAIAEQLRRRGVDVVAVTERPDLAGQDDTVVLRAAKAEQRVLVTNNVRDYAPLAEQFGLRGEAHCGRIFTYDASFPRSSAGIGLRVRALATFVARTAEEDLVEVCVFLPRAST